MRLGRLFRASVFYIRPRTLIAATQWNTYNIYGRPRERYLLCISALAWGKSEITPDRKKSRLLSS